MSQRRRPTSRDFRLLRGGQFAGDLGGQLSLVALPVAVVLGLHASAFAVGALSAIEWGVIPLLAIAVGVVVDRRARRPLMVGANLARLAALGALGIVAACGALRLWEIFVVAAVVGAAAVVFDTAYQAHLPTLVEPDELVGANERMQLGASAAETAGSSLGGPLVALAGAPFALALTACGYVASTAALLGIRRPEPLRAVRSAGFRTEAREGIALVLRDRALRVLALASMVAHVGVGIVSAAWPVFVFRDLHLGPVVVGLILALGNAGVVASLFAGRIAQRFGPRATLIASLALGGLGLLALPLAALGAPVAALLAGRILLSLAQPIFEITQQTVRVARTPAALHGRMNATMRTIVWAGLPAGALLGGWLGQAAGAAAALTVGGLVALAATALLLRLPPLAGDATAPRSRPALAAA